MYKNRIFRLVYFRILNALHVHLGTVFAFLNLRIDANIFIKHNFLLQTKDKMQNTMLRNTDPKREFAEAKADDYKPYLYLTPTSFVEKFLGIADIEDIILAEENEPLIDLNESLWVSYDSDFVKNDKFNENIYVISPMYVSFNKHCIFDRNDIRKIFKAKNVFIKVGESKIIKDYGPNSNRSILSIDLKPASFVNKDGKEIEYYPCKAFADGFFVGCPEMIRERIAKRSIKV